MFHLCDVCTTVARSSAAKLTRYIPLVIDSERKRTVRCCQLPMC